jgi:hypothetical protein
MSRASCAFWLFDLFSREPFPGDLLRFYACIEIKATTILTFMHFYSTGGIIIMASLVYLLAIEG